MTFICDSNVLDRDAATIRVDLGARHDNTFNSYGQTELKNLFTSQRQFPLIISDNLPVNNIH